MSKSIIELLAMPGLEDIDLNPSCLTKQFYRPADLS
jgi:hypothetical protein